ncbi:MAG: hypothetical protein KQI81_15235 [Deltaproteobacteria bacterium]|nr:hypothetical protein [Deltaproteobacteria bacterium]
MKTLLFATDHLTPDRKALDYALVLCRRMRAGLEVLHILQGTNSVGNPGKHRHTPVHLAGNDYAGAVVTATVGEAGLHDPSEALKAAASDQFQRLLPDPPDTRIDYRCVVTGEPTRTIIERYVRNHRHIVLTVFDPRLHHHPSGARKKESRPAGGKAMPKLPIPLVLVKNAHSIPTKQEALRHAKSIQEIKKEHPHR